MCGFYHLTLGSCNEAPTLIMNNNFLLCDMAMSYREVIQGAAAVTEGRWMVCKSEMLCVPVYR